MSESEIIKLLDNDDRTQFNSGFPNINYIGSKSKNTVLHIMSLFKNRYNEYLPRIDRILKDHPRMINAVNSRKRTFLHEAFKYINYELIKHILNNYEIDLYIKDDKNLTLFSWACSRGILEIIIKLLEKGSPYFESDIKLISDDTIRQQVGDILFGNKSIEYDISLDEDLPEDDTFKIYKDDDFIFDQKQTAGKGTYGVAIVVVDKNTGKKCVLKKFGSLEDGKYFYDDQVVRDITYLRCLKKRKHTVQIYGVFIDNTNRLYIVMEFLEREISDQFKLIRNVKDINKRREYYKYLLYELLIGVDSNSKTGINHCDTKANNLMINKFGIAKYIDYGFSYYNGISPYIGNVNKRIHNGIYLSQDGRPEKTTIEYYNVKDTHKILFTIKQGFIGYNIDIPSIGMMFVHLITGYTTNRCIYHNGELYFNVKPLSPDESKFSVEVLNSEKQSLINEYGNELFNFIMKLLEVDPNIRPTAKELLSDPFFGRDPIDYPRNLELTNIDFNYSGEHPDKEFIKKILSNYNTITANNYVRTGFVYFDDILKNWSNDTLRIVKRDNVYHKNLKELLEICNYRYICEDAFFNAIIYINESLINGVFTLDELRRNDNIYMISILAYFIKMYSDEKFDFTQISNYKYSVSKDTLKILVGDASNRMIKDTNFFKMKPIMLYVGYIKFIMQAICKDKVKIENIMIQLVTNLYSLLTDRNSPIPEGEYNIFEFVKYAYQIIPNKIEINMPSSITL